MQESFWSNDLKYPNHETFSSLQVSPDTPFFARLDGRRFKAISEKVGAEKPFDERFARCLTMFGRPLFESSFNPALVYMGARNSRLQRAAPKASEKLPDNVSSNQRKLEPPLFSSKRRTRFNSSNPKVG